MAAAAVKFCDLGLPAEKQSAGVKQGETSSFTTAVGQLWSRSARHLLTPNSENFTPAIGTTQDVHCKGDTGLFGTIFEVWANHWNLRTTPEDWWLPVITWVATLVDAHADDPAVRALFVGSQQGKKELVVELPSFSIYDSDYNYLFAAFSDAIGKNILVPGYVDAVSADFSTSEAAHRISSQITLMKSFQKYFDYTMRMCGCGIKALEMTGTEADWSKLLSKLSALRTLLKPLEDILRLDRFFSLTEEVFVNLHRTFNGDPAMQRWWADVLIQGKEYEYGPSGMRRGEVDAYNGWLVPFLTGGAHTALKASGLTSGKYAEALSCLSSCPMKIIDVPRSITGMSAVVGGMLGYQIVPGTTATPTLSPVHGWCLMLPSTSRLRACE